MNQDFPFTIREVAELLGLHIRHKNTVSLDVDCPFCGDRKGKLNLNLKKNVFKCNRCGESGGMLALYGKIYGLDNQTACKEIKDALGRNEQAPVYEVKRREIKPEAEPEVITLEQAPELRTSSVPELLERVKESTADALTQRGVTLQMECHAERLDMDADLMQSVLVNLVDNAGKASQPGQTVSLTADAAGFTVRDHGCGIPREEIERITEPFYMVDRSRSKKQGGVGLGLALVKEIVRAHGGRLEIESAVDEGTTVRVLMQK